MLFHFLYCTSHVVKPHMNQTNIPDPYSIPHYHPAMPYYIHAMQPLQNTKELIQTLSLYHPPRTLHHNPRTLHRRWDTCRPPHAQTSRQCRARPLRSHCARNTRLRTTPQSNQLTLIHADIQEIPTILTGRCRILPPRHMNAQAQSSTSAVVSISIPRWLCILPHAIYTSPVAGPSLWFCFRLGCEFGLGD